MVASVRLLILAAVFLSGCAGVESARRAPAEPDSAPTDSQPSTPTEAGGALIAASAERLVGSRYRFGGSGPEEFDCSGLVFYVHREHGIDVPRTAAEQFQLAHPVTIEELQAGDLVFFRNGGGPEVDHVGVYVGNGAMVHAPKTGRPVTHDRLDRDYYASHFAGFGRFYDLP